MEIDYDSLPAARHPSERVIDSCIFRAADHHQLNPLVLKAIRRQEAGRVGMANRNSNGSHDLGVMQINTINLDNIRSHYPKVTPYDLVYKACVNIFIGAWFLKEKIKNANGDIWKGVGNYHSGTPHLHKKYLSSVQDHYRDVLKEYFEEQASKNPRTSLSSSSRKKQAVIGIYQTQ